jgi:hypothetical protein
VNSSVKGQGEVVTEALACGTLPPGVAVLALTLEG